MGNNSNHVVEEIPDSSDFHVLAKTNPNISINPIENLINLNLNKDNSIDLNQQNLNEESENEINTIN